MRTILASRVTRRVSIAVAVSAALITASAAAASAATTASGTRAAVSAGSTASTRSAAGSAAGHGLAQGTRFFVPPPSSGAPQQVLQLLKGHDLKDAKLIAEMETYPRAVWFTSGTPAQVTQQVRQTMAQAAIQRAVPVLVAYDIPGRDCAQYSAGGALTQADYQAWIAGFAAGIGRGKAIVILEPDSLGLLPSNCGGPSSTYPFTDDERYAEIQYAVTTLEAQPGASVYLDGTHSAWQSVGTMTQRLLAAGVQQSQGFFINVSNYQPTPNLVDYGTWISDCIAMVTQNSFNPANCGSQYYPANP